MIAYSTGKVVEQQVLTHLAGESVNWKSPDEGQFVTSSKMTDASNCAQQFLPWEQNLTDTPSPVWYDNVKGYDLLQQKAGKNYPPTGTTAKYVRVHPNGRAP